MNECNCEEYNCKHNVYIQPPKSVSQQKPARYVRSGIPMQFESEQKLSYKNYSTKSNTPMNCSFIKANCFRDSLKYGFQHPFETIQHSSYKKWTFPNNIVIKKPKDCVDLLGHGPINFNTSQKIEYQRKMTCQESKHYKPACNIMKFITPIDNQSTYHTSYNGSKTEKQNVESLKSKNTYMTPTKKMEMMTTNNISYKYWAGSSINSNTKNNSNCLKKYPIDHQTIYNYSYSEPGTYSKETKFASSLDDVCIRECCKKN